MEAVTRTVLGPAQGTCPGGLRGRKSTRGTPLVPAVEACLPGEVCASCLFGDLFLPSFFFPSLHPSLFLFLEMIFCLRDWIRKTCSSVQVKSQEDESELICGGHLSPPHALTRI